jgi:subtilisin family serine protease
VPQYTIEQLHLTEAHTLATGKDIKVGILDTGIGPGGVDLAGSVASSYDAVAAGSNEDLSHGTALAGIIAAHGQLTGVAPGVMLLSARAFVASNGQGPSSTSFVLLKGLDWLAANGAQVVNMSFAGPSDPLFLGEIKAAHDKGIVAVAAVGNDGPKAAPEFPAADPSTIGVTGVDDADVILAVANHGDYVAVAAPGVDVPVITPDGGLNVSSGTSIAAAHVSGAAALLLEHNPSLTPDALEKLLLNDALDLGPKGRDRTFGAGLIEPLAALQTKP